MPEQQSALVFTNVLEIPSAIIASRFAKRGEKKEKERRRSKREKKEGNLSRIAGPACDCDVEWMEIKLDTANIKSNLTISSATVELCHRAGGDYESGDDDESK